MSILQQVMFSEVRNHFNMKIENFTVSIPEKIPGNSYCRLKSRAKGTQFKISSERLSPEIDILIRSTIPELTEIDVD